MNKEYQPHIEQFNISKSLAFIFNERSLTEPMNIWLTDWINNLKSKPKILNQ